MESVRITDDQSKEVQKTRFRVSLDSILARIDHEDYEHPGRHPTMTLCILTLDNGFVVIGKSVPADPDNFDQELGKKFAKEDAIRQIWPMEAYLLRERMSL
jgi:Phage protein (N4 Gp49/phage Sf6 gene 66) family